MREGCVGKGDAVAQGFVKIGNFSFDAGEVAGCDSGRDGDASTVVYFRASSGMPAKAFSGAQAAEFDEWFTRTFKPKAASAKPTPSSARPRST